MDIQDFYKHVLTGLRYRVGEDDLISFMAPGGTVTPATVDKRRLVLPTKERLRAGFDTDLQPFHPLAESIARKGASPVLAHMQRTAKAVLAHYFVELSTRLMAVASDTSLHKDLPPSCSDYLKKLPNADKKSLTDFTALIEKAVTKNKLITVYLKHGGKLDGEKYNRLCVVHFPFVDLLNTDEETVLGVKLRKKDRKTFQALLHHVLPFGDDPEHYSAGSNSRIAPFFDAFMQAYTKTAEQFNKIIKRYGKAIDLNLPEIPLDYLDGLADLGSFYEKIPSLRGNEGEVGKGEEEPVAAAPTPATVTPAVAASYSRINKEDDGVPPWESKPVAPEAPPTHVQRPPQRAGQTGGGMSMDEFRNRIAPPPPAYAQPPQMPEYGQAPVPPGYNQYAHYQQAPVNDPKRPAWLVGQQAPQQPQNPFAQALMPMQPTPAVQPYGAYSGVSNFAGGGSGHGGQGRL